MPANICRPSPRPLSDMAHHGIRLGWKMLVPCFGKDAWPTSSGLANHSIQWLLQSKPSLISPTIRNAWITLVFANKDISLAAAQSKAAANKFLGCVSNERVRVGPSRALLPRPKHAPPGSADNGIFWLLNALLYLWLPNNFCALPLKHANCMMIGDLGHASGLPAASGILLSISYQFRHCSKTTDVRLCNCAFSAFFERRTRLSPKRSSLAGF